ncbi:hypothetical protein MTBGP_18890 [Moorella thermoacetica]|uniref:hypothetical protein n=1 Tax=Neomoorella thermoacetica TaxID=1525 RepID=UPI0030CE1450
MLNCPHCGSKSIGKIGTDQYYCWDCFVEFNNRREIFNVAEDGSLVSQEGQGS